MAEYLPPDRMTRQDVLAIQADADSTAVLGLCAYLLGERPLTRAEELAIRNAGWSDLTYQAAEDVLREVTRG